MRKEILKQELEKEFNEVQYAYNLENGQIVESSLTLKKDDIVYNVDFADNIFKYSPSTVVNHLERSIENGTLRNRKISLEEEFITNSLINYNVECCYVRLLDGHLEYGKGLNIDLSSLKNMYTGFGIIVITDKDNNIFKIDLNNNKFTCLNNVKEEGLLDYLENLLEENRYYIIEV